VELTYNWGRGPGSYRGGDAYVRVVVGTGDLRRTRADLEGRGVPVTAGTVDGRESVDCADPDGWRVSFVASD